MDQNNIGIIILIVASVVIYLGFAQRALDRMRLSDRGALLVIGAIIVGSYINIPLPFLPYNTSFNVGGALVPVGLANYLLVKAGSGKNGPGHGGSAERGGWYLSALYPIQGRPWTGGALRRTCSNYDFIQLWAVLVLISRLIFFVRELRFSSRKLGVLLVDVFTTSGFLIKGAR